MEIYDAHGIIVAVLAGNIECVLLLLEQGKQQLGGLDVMKDGMSDSDVYIQERVYQHQIHFVLHHCFSPS